MKRSQGLMRVCLKLCKALMDLKINGSCEMSMRKACVYLVLVE